MNRMSSAVKHMVRNGTVPESATLKIVAPLVPKLEALSNDMLKVANLNRAVHVSTYNAIIRERALALSS
jgi:hypothetical protein